MSLTIDQPFRKTDSLPISIPHGSNYLRFELEYAEDNFGLRHSEHFSAFLNCRVLDPFLARVYLNGVPARGPSGLLTRNVVVTDESLMLQNGEIFLPDEELPGYLKQVAESPRFHDAIQRYKAVTPQHKIGMAFILSHFHSRYYGHFITEIAPKLALIRLYYQYGHRIPVYVGAAEKGYVKEFLQLALPEAEIICCPPGELLLVETCLVPSWNRMHLLGKYHLDFLDDLVHLSEGIPIERKEQIYVSREHIAPSFRIFENEREIRKIIEDMGFSVVHPEALSLAEQINLFANARCIVGEYGSGLHNAIFSKGNTAVIAFNWINPVQQAIGISRRHKNVFIMPSQGVPITDTPRPFNVKGEFQISGDLVQESVRLIRRF